MDKIFISHSSKDENIVKSFLTLCTSIGIKPDLIFCSSFEGQGVKNGQRINSTIKNEINFTKVIVYIVTKNFIESPFCTQELGAACLLDNNKPFFIFKTDDLTPEDLNGFIDSSYKYSLLNREGVSSFCDWISEHFETTKKISIINNAITTFLKNIKGDIDDLIEDKSKTEKQKREKRIKFFENQYKDLPIGAKQIIAEIYFSEDGVGYYSMSNGTIGMLSTMYFVYRTTTISAGGFDFAYALQTWVINFIKKNPNVQKELKSLDLKRRRCYRDGINY